jgi:hypothetical protein
MTEQTAKAMDEGVEAQDKRRLALIERMGTIADLACSKPLEGELGDVAYDLLREAAAQISSDRLRLAAMPATQPAQVGEMEEIPFAYFQWNDGWSTWEQVADEYANEPHVVPAYRAALTAQEKKRDD